MGVTSLGDPVVEALKLGRCATRDMSNPDHTVTGSVICGGREPPISDRFDGCNLGSISTREDGVEDLSVESQARVATIRTEGQRGRSDCRRDQDKTPDLDFIGVSGSGSMRTGAEDRRGSRVIRGRVRVSKFDTEPEN